MSFDQLPAELLHNVCSHCSKHDIRSLRLTSRFTSAVADEYFLQDLIVFFLRSEFEMVEEIVKNPRIAKGVRSIRFQADRLVSRGDGKRDFGRLRKIVARQGVLVPPKGDDAVGDATPEESERQRRQRRRELAKHKTPAPAKLSANEAEFLHLKLYLEQSDLLEDRGKICMQRLFTACPKLDSATVAMQQFADTEPHLISPAPWHSVRTYVQLQVTPWRDDMPSRINWRPSNEMLTAAFETGRKLKSLTLSPISHQFFCQEEEDMAEIKSVICELEKLHICLDCEFKFDIDDSAKDAQMQAMEEEGMAIEEIMENVAETDIQAERRVLSALEDGRVAHFLHQAPSLREITLKGPMVTSPNTELMDLPCLIGSNPPWKDLRSLTLLEFSCEHAQLISFILKYRDSLEHLRLESAEIDSWLDCWGVWEPIAGQLPKLKTVHMDKIMLRGPGVGHRGASAAEDVEQFILTGERSYADILM